MIFCAVSPVGTKVKSGSCQHLLDIACEQVFICLLATVLQAECTPAVHTLVMKTDAP